MISHSFSLIRYPDASILPILEVRPDGAPKELLGTGFLISPVGALVTARHVLRGRPSDAESSLFVIAKADDESIAWSARDLRRITKVNLSTRIDVAIAEIDEVEGLQPLYLRPGEIGTNEDVLTLDYSSTVVRTNEPDVRFSPGTLRGNVVRHYISDFPATAGMRCFDTSFPALQGASGAPVLTQPGFSVVGMLVGNVQRHLIPAQVARIEEMDSVIEEIRYLLPFGQALEADEIIRALTDFGLNPGQPAAF